MLHLPNKAMTYTSLFLAFTLLAAPPGFSQEGKKKKFSNKDRQEPIEITSDRMRSENGGQKIIFSGNVVIVQAGMAITADIMEVYNTPDKKQTEEIVAIGNVDIVRGKKRMKGDRAVYLYQLQKIILTGSPKAIAWEGNDTIEGREMIFLIEKDRFVVNERVRAKLFPKSGR
jgi:lipopolysaccharide transport protein LptA|tara:strand:- start:615 stop:1130 length:516 start_codon:yes stop_codon:yes gene_type:complete